MNNFNNIRKGIVLLVVNKNGEILVLKQKRNNAYSFISGGIENDELPEEAIVREAKEEVGLKIDKDKLINTGQIIKFTGSRKGHAEQQVFMYRLEQELQLRPDDFEISNLRWSNKSEAIKLLKNKPPLTKIIKNLL